MTVSSRPTPSSQEPEPQRSGVQQTQSSVAQPQSEVAVNPQPLPSSIRRKVVGKPGWSSSLLKDASIQATLKHEATLPETVQPAGESGLSDSPEQKDHMRGALGWSSSLLKDVSIQATYKQETAPQEIENGNIILYRSPNFFLRTAHRPGQKQNPLRKPTGNTMVTPKVMPHQETRIAASDTHVMPNVTLNTAKQTRAIPLPTWLEAVLVVLSLATAFVIHAYNMFNFPRYELDEGTYMSNAWAITQGLISPYPYGYGHPPLAWMQIAAWIQLTGGPFTFGNALNSGRVFMLFYAVGSALLVYLIVRRWSGSRSAA